MPSSPITQNRTLETVFLILFILAFFPGLPQFLFCLPFHALVFIATYPHRNTPPASPATTPSPLSPPLPPTLLLPPNSAQQDLASSSVSPTSMASSSWFQKTISLPPSSRGSYLVTDQVVAALPELKSYRVGLLHLFVQHTSCALSLNENWDSDVRRDMSDALDRIVPEDRKGELYRHSCEGPDDMPAHVKSALVGASVTVPISNGKLATGTWQGIWYLEFRTAKHSRKMVATIQGEKNA